MSGRPQQDEAAEYYFTYVNQAPGKNVRALMERQLAEWPAMFAGISEGHSLHRYAPDKWSIRQVLNHVNDGERVFAHRAMWFARGFETALPSFDQNVGVAGADADKVSWAAHVEEFRSVREASIALFRNLQDAAWGRRGIASDKPFTVRALAFIIAGHAAHHVRILRERYLAAF